MWVAPNLITIVGLVINIVTSAVLVSSLKKVKCCDCIIFLRCGIVRMPQSDRLGLLHWLRPLDFFSTRAWMPLMENKQGELGPAVH